MNCVARDVVIGLLASLFPIYLLSNKCQSLGKKCPNVGDIIVMFVVINVILLPILRKFGVRNMAVIGLILSIVYSSIGRFVGNIPQDIFMIDPNLFQLYALIMWPIVYSVIGELLY